MIPGMCGRYTGSGLRLGVSLTPLISELRRTFLVGLPRMRPGTPPVKANVDRSMASL